jgi:hypothetical protein
MIIVDSQINISQNISLNRKKKYKKYQYLKLIHKPLELFSNTSSNKIKIIKQYIEKQFINELFF